MSEQLKYTEPLYSNEVYKVCRSTNHVAVVKTAARFFTLLKTTLQEAAPSVSCAVAQCIHIVSLSYVLAIRLGVWLWQAH